MTADPRQPTHAPLPCPFCGELPLMSSIDPTYAACATERCAAEGNAVPLVKWNRRALVPPARTSDAWVDDPTVKAARRALLKSAYSDKMGALDDERALDALCAAVAATGSAAAASTGEPAPMLRDSGLLPVGEPVRPTGEKMESRVAQSGGDTQAHPPAGAVERLGRGRSGFDSLHDSPVSSPPASEGPCKRCEIVGRVGRGVALELANGRTSFTADPRQPTPAPLPCPFCGSTDVSTWLFLRGTKRHPAQWHVGCEGSGCDVLPVCEGKTEVEAVERWNRRAPVAGTPVTREQVAKIVIEREPRTQSAYAIADAVLALFPSPLPKEERR